MNKYKSRFDRVLVIDDNRSDYEIIQSFLDDIDVACENAANMAKALSMYRSVESRYYSLILMNIAPAGPDSFEVPIELKEALANVPTTTIVPIGKSCNTISAYEFYFHIAPYIENAMLYTIRLKGALDKMENAFHVDTDICDVFFGVSNMGCDESIFLKHFKKFQSTRGEVALELNKMIEEKRLREASQLCLSIREISAMLGLKRICRHITALEKTLKDEGFSQKCPALLSQIDEDMNELQQIQF